VQNRKDRRGGESKPATADVIGYRYSDARFWKRDAAPDNAQRGAGVERHRVANSRSAIIRNSDSVNLPLFLRKSVFYIEMLCFQGFVYVHNSCNPLHKRYYMIHKQNFFRIAIGPP
jgi:hypothetical protein